MSPGPHPRSESWRARRAPHAHRLRRQSASKAGVVWYFTRPADGRDARTGGRHSSCAAIRPTAIWVSTSRSIDCHRSVQNQRWSAGTGKTGWSSTTPSFRSTIRTCAPGSSRCMRRCRSGGNAMVPRDCTAGLRRRPGQHQSQLWSGELLPVRVALAEPESAVLVYEEVAKLAGLRMFRRGWPKPDLGGGADEVPATTAGCGTGLA